MPQPETKKPGRPRRSTLRRRLWRGFLWTALVYLSPVLVGCMNFTTPVDYVMNLGTFDHDPALKASSDGVRRLVVLRHGLWRSAWSLWKMERALRDHGYETINLSYGSTRGFIESHARAMRAEIEEVLRVPDERKLELYFVGHSMGGLQIRYYLAQPGARRPDACVFLATPHRGAVLTDKRKNWWLFKIFLGTEGAAQLSPGDPFYAKLRRLDCDCGVVFGGLGDGVGWNDDIPGDDDGTVGIDEVQLPEAKDRIHLKLGHTSLSYADAPIRQVLHFLKHRRFDHGK